MIYSLWTTSFFVNKFVPTYEQSRKIAILASFSIDYLKYTSIIMCKKEE